jgi:hypothetical protein
MSLTKVSSAVLNIDDLYGFRNRIINGDMRIDQRNAGAAVTVGGSYPVDRFSMQNITDGAFSAQRDTTVPAGFINSVKITITAADTSLTGTQNLIIFQRIEGFNAADLGWGTASAQNVTLSFWVRSSLTGTFGGAIRNNGGTRSYPYAYTISSANTYEYKTITIPGDTSGTWLTDSGIGMQVDFSLGAGPDRTGTAGVWAAGNFISTTGATSVVGTSGATFYITGVQLEAGSVATPFERRPYGTELALCQRYFEISCSSPAGFTSRVDAVSVIAAASDFNTSNEYKITKRSAPTIALFAAVSGTQGNVRDINVNANTSAATAFVGINRFLMNSSGVDGRVYEFHWTASAEL